MQCDIDINIVKINIYRAYLICLVHVLNLHGKIFNILLCTIVHIRMRHSKCQVAITGHITGTGIRGTSIKSTVESGARYLPNSYKTKRELLNAKSESGRATKTKINNRNLTVYDAVIFGSPARLGGRTDKI